MIVWASTALMGYELVATATRRPTITKLSHRWPYSMFVWGWLLWLIGHLVFEAVSIPRGTKL